MKHTAYLVAGLVVGLVAASTATLALASSHDETIDACITRRGTVKIHVDGRPCKRNQTPVSWNSEGPAGQDGADGIDGVRWGLRWDTGRR